MRLEVCQSGVLCFHYAPYSLFPEDDIPQFTINYDQQFFLTIQLDSVF